LTFFYHRQFPLFALSGHWQLAIIRILSPPATRHSPLAAGLKLASFFRIDFALVGHKSQHAND